MDEVRLQLQPVAAHVGTAVVFQLGELFAVPRAGAVVPAVAPLFAEVALQVRVVGPLRLRGLLHQPVDGGLQRLGRGVHLFLGGVGLGVDGLGGLQGLGQRRPALLGVVRLVQGIRRGDGRLEGRLIRGAGLLFQGGDGGVQGVLGGVHLVLGGVRVVVYVLGPGQGGSQLCPGGFGVVRLVQGLGGADGALQGGLVHLGLGIGDLHRVDGYAESAAVVAVVAVGVHREEQLVAGLDLIGLVEAQAALVGEVALGVAAHPLLFGAVQEDADAGAVGGGVLAVGELHIAAGDADGSFLGHDPLIGGVLAAAGLHVVLFELGLAAVVHVALVFRVVGQDVEARSVPGAAAVVPAGLAVGAGEVLRQNRVVDAVGLRLGDLGIRLGLGLLALLRRADADHQPAAVIAVVALGVHGEDQLVAGLHRQGLPEGVAAVLAEVAHGLAAHPLGLHAVDEEADAGAVGAGVGAVGELGVCAVHHDAAVLGDDPLVGGVLAVAGLHEVLLQLRLAVVVIALVLRVVGQHGEIPAVPVAEAVVPAVIALLGVEAVGDGGGVGPVGIRLHHVHAGRGHGAVADADGEPAGVPGGVGVGGDLEAESVALLHLQRLEGEGKHVVLAVALQGLDLLLQQQGVVVPDLQGHAVGPVGVGILVAELDVGALQLQVVLVGGGDPLVDGVLAGAGMDVVLLHLQGLGLLGDPGGLVGVHLGQELGVGQGGALQEPPAVLALPDGGQGLQVGVVVLAGGADDGGGGLDHHGELAAVPGPVVVSADHEAELVAPLHIEAVKAEADDVVVAVAPQDLDLLAQQLPAVVPDLQGHAVGPVGVGVLLAELHVLAGDIHAAGLAGHPLIDGIPGVAGVDVAVLHLQALGAAGGPALTVLGHLGEDLGVAQGAALQEEPAVGALLHRAQIPQGGVVVPVAGLDLGGPVGVLDHEHVLAAVVGGVGAGVYDHGDAVALLDGDAVNRQAGGLFPVRIGREIDLPQHVFVVHQVDGDAVGPAGVGVLVLELGVFQVDVDSAVLGGHPLDVGGLAVGGGDDIVLLDLQTVGHHIAFAVLQLLHVGGQEGVQTVAELIVPAVPALLAEVVLGGGEVVPALGAGGYVLFGLARQAAEAGDGELIVAAVVGDVVQAVDHQGDVVALLHGQRFHVQALGDGLLDLGLKILLVQEGAVVIEGNPGAVGPGGVLVLVLQFRIGRLDADDAVLGHLPLDDGGAAMLAGIHVVPLDLQPAAVEVAVLLLVEVAHVVGVEGLVRPAALEEPAVAALGAEVRGDVGEVLPGLGGLHLHILLRLGAVHVDDGDVKGAAVIGGVALGVHEEVQRVPGGHGQSGGPEGDAVLPLVGGVHMLLVEELIVQVDLDLYAVGEVRVAVVLLELAVVHPQIHVAVHGGGPGQARVVVQGGVDEALADGQAGGAAVDVAALVGLVGDSPEPGGVGAAEIAPAARALGAEVLLAVGVVVLPAGLGLRLGEGGVHVPDVDVEAAAVIGVVAAGGYHKVEALALLHFQRIQPHFGQQLLGGADGGVFQLQQLAALVDQQLHAVGVAGVGVAVDVLEVGQHHVDLPLLGRPPLQDGRELPGGVQEAALDLQAVGAHLGVDLSVEALDLLGALGLLGVAVAVEPAVLALLAEVLHVEGVVGAGGILGIGGLLVALRLKGRGPGGRAELHLADLGLSAAAAAKGAQQGRGAQAQHQGQGAADGDPSGLGGQARALFRILFLFHSRSPPSVIDFDVFPGHTGVGAEQLPVGALAVIHSGGQGQLPVEVETGYAVADENGRVELLLLGEVEGHAGLGIVLHQVFRVVEFHPALLGVEDVAQHSHVLRVRGEGEAEDALAAEAADVRLNAGAPLRGLEADDLIELALHGIGPVLDRDGLRHPLGALGDQVIRPGHRQLVGHGPQAAVLVLDQLVDHRAAAPVVVVEIVMADLGAVPAHQIEPLAVGLQPAGVEAVAVHGVLGGLLKGPCHGVADPVVDHPVRPLVGEGQIPLAAELQQAGALHVGGVAHVVGEEDALEIPLAQVCGAVAEDDAGLRRSGGHQHPPALLLLRPEHVGVAEVVDGVARLGSEALLGVLGPAEHVAAGGVHHRLLGLPEIVVAGVEGVVGPLLILDHAAGAQGDVLVLGGLAVGKHDARVLEAPVVFRAQQAPGMVAQLAVPLVGQEENVHFASVKEGHGVAHQSIRHREEHRLRVVRLGLRLLCLSRSPAAAEQQRQNQENTDCFFHGFLLLFVYLQRENGNLLYICILAYVHLIYNIFYKIVQSLHYFFPLSRRGSVTVQPMP